MISPRADTGAALIAILMSLVLSRPQSAQAQIRLEYKFPECKKLTYKTTSRTRQVLTFGGTNIESSRRDTKVWCRLVGKRRHDLALPIDEKVLSLRVEYSLPPATKLVLDSSSSDVTIADNDVAFLASVFKLEREASYTVILDERNQVRAIQGAEKLVEQAKKLGDPISREEMQSEFKAATLKQRFEQMLHSLPSVPANVGEPWERNEFLEISGKAFAVSKKYEYVGSEKKGDQSVDKISCKVIKISYNQDPESKLPLKVAKSDLKVESSDGTILFDRDGGHIVSASNKLRIKGNMTFAGGGVDQSGGFELIFDTSTQLQPSAS
jgi:hypothetical protein